MSVEVRQRAQARLRWLRGLAATSAGASVAACVGYGVVDPVPEPYRCEELRPGQIGPLIQVDGYLEARTGEPLLTVYLDPGRDVEERLIIGGSPTITNGALIGSGSERDRLTRVIIQVAPGASTVELQLPLSCGEIAEDARWRFDLGSPESADLNGIRIRAIYLPPAPAPGGEP